MIKYIFSFCLLVSLLSSCGSEEGFENNLNPSLSNDGLGISEFDGSISGGGIVGGQSGSETYDSIFENQFILVNDDPVSTFSIDADGGAYSNVRDLLASGLEIPQGAVRTEELVNYFQYDYPDHSTHPITINGEVASSPWTTNNRLIRIGIKGKEILNADLPRSNFVLLVDVSGSMSADNKLPLLKEGLKLLVDHLDKDDRLAIVTYARNPGVHLESTAVSERDHILKSIDGLNSGGSTNGEGGINIAYEIAEQHFVTDGNNRILLASDGDFNVGVSDKEELIELIEKKREAGIFLTTLGMGRGNYRDNIMEQLANNGNGTYEYLDNLEQCEKVFVQEFGKFFTVAKDVKVQVEFNSILVESYRLIGYENRVLETEDFDDDGKDAGEIGAGQEITALYEIKPTAIRSSIVPFFNVDFRYKLPDEDQSILISQEVFDEGAQLGEASESTRFAAGVASLGMYLNQSAYTGNVNVEDIRKMVAESKSYNPNGYKDGLEDLLQSVK